MAVNESFHLIETAFILLFLQPMYVRKLVGINVNKQEQE